MVLTRLYSNFRVAGNLGKSLQVIIILNCGLNEICSLNNCLHVIVSPPVNSFIKPAFNLAPVSGSCNTANLLPLVTTNSGEAAFEAALALVKRVVGKTQA